MICVSATYVTGRYRVYSTWGTQFPKAAAVSCRWAEDFADGFSREPDNRDGVNERPLAQELGIARVRNAGSVVAGDCEGGVCFSPNRGSENRHLSGTKTRLT